MSVRWTKVVGDKITDLEDDFVPIRVALVVDGVCSAELLCELLGKLPMRSSANIP